MGLVQYDSSDEEEDVRTEDSPAPQPAPSSITTTTESKTHRGPLPPETTSSFASPTSQHPPLGPIQGPVLGPALGPSAPPPPPPQPQPSTQEQQTATSLPPELPSPTTDIDLAFLNDPSPDPPRSPYTTARALARDLTLPAVADMEIPPSPPPTQHADMTSLNAKFDTFLQLKRRATDPAHFNSRLAASSALRNPSLMDKLLGFVGIETSFVEGDSAAAEQYATTVGRDVWDPDGFPDWAFRGSLRRAQEKEGRDRERARGEPVEFVSSSCIGAGSAGSGSAPVREQRRTMFDT